MTKPILMWFRRDLRLSDHPALMAACQSGQPVIPVAICDPQTAALGDAPQWRLGQGLGHLAQTLDTQGSRLILRRGAALDQLRDLIKDTGAGAVYWTRSYDPASVARDTVIKSTLRAEGIDAKSFGGHLLFEPWSVTTQTGGLYRVYTPFWNAVKTREVDAPLPAPARIPAPATWPAGDTLADWGLGAGMRRGAEVLARHIRLGEGAAQDRLTAFTDTIIAGYRDTRDFPGIDGTSGLSENLALGEISPHQCWHAGLRARHEGKAGAETFLKELVWREFAYHLLHHTPHITDRNWKPGWDQFTWNTDPDRPEVLAWKQGRTGVAFVDAAMREMYVTGRMHNRGRMIVASYLTKHLMTHWKIGQTWFDDCLTDWDPASNAMGWQWTAGSGPDASPYFRIFNPDTQLAKFDPDGIYRQRWLAETERTPSATALSYFDAIPKRWNLSPNQPYPEPVVDLTEGRARALGAYENRSF